MTAARRQRDTRERILDEARQLFGRDGYGATTVRRIASALGISDAAIYHHFSSKRALYEAAIKPPLPEQQRFNEFVGSVDELAEEIAAHQVLWSLIPDLPGMLIIGMIEGDKTTGDIVRQLVAHYRGQLEQVLRRTNVDSVELTAQAVAFLATGASIDAQLAHPTAAEVRERNAYFHSVIGRLLPVFVPEAAFGQKAVADAS